MQVEDEVEENESGGEEEDKEDGEGDKGEEDQEGESCHGNRMTCQMLSW